MRFYEYESKALFAKCGLPLAKSRIATSAAEARAAAAAIGGPVLLERQVLSGGGMKGDGAPKNPVGLFSDRGGIDMEEVAEKPPAHVSKTPFSTILPLSPRIAKEA